MWVKNADHQLRHEADSDELRAVAKKPAEGLREHFYGKIAQTNKRDNVESFCCRMRRDALPGRQYHADSMSCE